MTSVNGIFGNKGINYTTSVHAQNITKTNNLLFGGKVEPAGGAVQFSKTPGNTGVAEATARGTLAQLDLIEQIGL